MLQQEAVENVVVEEDLIRKIKSFVLLLLFVHFLISLSLIKLMKVILRILKERDLKIKQIFYAGFFFSFFLSFVLLCLFLLSLTFST